MGAVDDQRFKDVCLIFVGCGGKADEVLCKRRLQAGGRLAHFLMLARDRSGFLNRNGDLEIKDGNERSSINGAFNGKLIRGFSIALNK